MEPLLLLIVGTAMLLLGLALGAWFGARAPAAARDAAAAEAERLREEDIRHRMKLSEAGAEQAAAARRLAELAGAELARETLAGELAALRAQQAERDKGHAAEVARTHETFTALAGQALDVAQAKLALANEEVLARHREVAGAGLEANRTQLAELIAPMRDTLAKYEIQLGEVEKVRAESYGQLNQLLDQVAKGQDRVSSSAQKLENVLRSSSKAAGRWGEEQCRNVLEQAGLVENIDFVAQTADGSDDSRRPDFIVTLPGDRKLVIDVKCSIDAFMAAAGADEDDDRSRHLLAHAKAVRSHATGLAAKSYEKSVGGAVDFVVLFVPGENFLAAAFEHDRTLMTDFMAKRLVLAGPINLIAVARTVAAMRDQARLAEQAAEIAKLGRDLYDQVRIVSESAVAVGKTLGTTVRDWNKLVGQLDGRLLSRARKFEALGATTGLDKISKVAAIDLVPQLPAPGSPLPELFLSPAAEAAE